MPSKAMILASNSQNSDPLSDYGPEDRPALVLTSAAYVALSDRDDEYAYFCPDCLRVLASCSCPVEQV
jgi:hypothetical protein